MSKSAQQRIEESALILFSHQGFHETSISQIAKKAKLSEVTIFRIFGTKRDLYLEVIKQYFSDDDFNLNALMSELTFEDLNDDLIKIIMNFYKLYFERIHITRIMISNYIQFDEIRELGALIIPAFEAFLYKYLNEMIMRHDSIPSSLLVMPKYMLATILKDVTFLTTFNKKDILDDALLETLESKWKTQLDTFILMFSNHRES